MHEELAIHANRTPFPRRQRHGNLARQFVEGDCAFIVWDAETADNKFEDASDTFVIRDGKILVQTYAGKVTRKNEGSRV